MENKVIDALRRVSQGARYILETPFLRYKEKDSVTLSQLKRLGNIAKAGLVVTAFCAAPLPTIAAVAGLSCIAYPPKAISGRAITIPAEALAEPLHNLEGNSKSNSKFKMSPTKQNPQAVMTKSNALQEKKSGKTNTPTQSPVKINPATYYQAVESVKRQKDKTY